jgi:hypothetical protein
MKGMYFQFARLVIRLLLAIYRLLLAIHVGGAAGEIKIDDMVSADAQAWLEHYQ